MSLSTRIVVSLLTLDIAALAVAAAPGPERAAGQIPLTLELVQENAVSK